MKLDDREVPVTPACRAALEVATAYCSPALLNHSLRANLWAAGYGLERGIAFDKVQASLPGGKVRPQRLRREGRG